MKNTRAFEAEEYCFSPVLLGVLGYFSELSSRNKTEGTKTGFAEIVSLSGRDNPTFDKTSKSRMSCTGVPPWAPLRRIHLVATRC